MRDSFSCNKVLLFRLFYCLGNSPHSKLHHYRLIYHNLNVIHFYSFLHISLLLQFLLTNKSDWPLFSSSWLLLFQPKLMIDLKPGSDSCLLHAMEHAQWHFHSFRFMISYLKQSFCLIKQLKHSCMNYFMKRIYHQDVFLHRFLDKHNSFSHCYHMQQKQLMTELVGSY